MEEIRKQLLLGMGFSEKAIDVLEKGLNMGSMENPSITAQHEGTYGDIMILHLKIEDNKIIDTRYEYVGCAGLQACASAVTEVIKGETLDQAYTIEIEDIIDFLVSIPQQKYECAEISRDTLRKAINEWSA